MAQNAIQKERLEALRKIVSRTGAEEAEWELLEAGKDLQVPVDVVIPTPINAAGPEVKIQGGKTNIKVEKPTY